NVYWGDGTSTSYNGQTSNYKDQIIFNQAIEHVYQNYGEYKINFYIVNPSNNSSAADTIDFVYGSCDNYFYSSVQLDCDNNGTIDSTLANYVNFILTNTTGQTYSFSNFNNQGFIKKMVPGTYTLSVDPAWLTINEYYVENLTPQTVTINANGGNQFTFQVLLKCNSSATACVLGKVYCDENQNGIFDPSEAIIPNVPLSVSYLNQVYLDTTDGYGQYYVSFLNPNQGPAIISLNSSWLTQNGYYSNNYVYSDTVYITECDTSSLVPINFGINCDTTQVQSECIGGVVFCDANQNGTREPNEQGLASAPIHISGQTGNITIYSDNNGMFYYAGNYLGGSSATITIDQNWLTQNGFTVSQNVITVSTDCNNSTPVYLPVNCGSQNSCADLSAGISPWQGYYQNFTNRVRMSWGNNGFSPALSYTLSLTFPSGVTPVVSTFKYSNYIISGNTITWTFSSYQSYFSDSDVIGFSVPFGFPSGTQHTYTLTITATGSNQDCNSSNNQSSTMMVLGNSYDPNDKNVNKPNYINPNVQDELTYTIRFQNTGDAPAQDIYVIDTLSALLDLSTFTIKESTHNLQVIDLGNGVKKFNFPGIWLPDSTTNEPASHGLFIYSVKENVGNGKGTRIENTAYIYFDNNPAIITNTTVNENNILGLNEKVLEDVRIFPNPTNGRIEVRTNADVEQIHLVDITGKLLKIQNGENKILDLQPYENGSYILRVISKNGVYQQKVLLIK
ncbi:MAG: T9SS type A sorting domain-containing protein, partial [Bacteroidetes bacterium]|nr:T9SS type A sorting domain-containing protein [Bacteroidota bacterium]